MSQNENIASEAAQDEILASILQKLSAPSPTPTASSATAAASSTPPSSGGGGDLLASLLSNPELIAKLPAILSSIKPIIDMLKTSGIMTTPVSATVSAAPEAPDSVAASSDGEQTGDVPAALIKHSPGADSRTALLCAMKPYLSHDRQNAIDYIVKIGRLGDILKTL